MTDNKLTKEQAERFWKMAYRFNDNIKMYMDVVYEEKKGVITDKEINDLENYRIDGCSNVIKNTLFG